VNQALPIVIVGGVAGGASCAARLRRNDEQVPIVMLERGPHVSFANCGLPYFIGNVINDESKLLVADVELFRRRFNVDARVNQKVVAIDRTNKQLEVENGDTGNRYTLAYQKLVLSPGAQPVRPPLPGIDLPGIFTLRNVPDSVRIKEWISTHAPRNAVVIGAGFIGLEMTENLIRQGIGVTLVERDKQVMPALDPEMTIPVRHELESRGVQLALGETVSGFTQVGDRIEVSTQSGHRWLTDIVILSIGVAPDSHLARDAGLELGPRGHIVVDETLRTSDADIFAIGDAIELTHFVTGSKTAIPLAGPANRQGRIVADVIAGRPRSFRGAQGTAVCGVFDQTIAITGANDKSLKQTDVEYDVAYAHPGHHVGYYPGAKPIFLKLLFQKSDGRLLGAQAVGEAGVERRMDVIAMAIQKNGTVFDLEEAELCYAPQYGAAKDPINIIGMIASNVIRGDLKIAPWQEVGKNGAVVLDVRDDDECACKPTQAQIHIPLNDLRARCDELPKDQPVQICCAVGARAYNATRLLVQRGYDAQLLSGGAETWFCVQQCIE